MKVARNTRRSFRSSPARENSNRNSRFTEFQSGCRKHATKRFSNRNKTPFLCPPRRNAFFGISAPIPAPAPDPLRSYPFAQLREAVRSRPARMLPLEIAPRRLG